jgi:anaerobic glycerol-3-phosphate dehydrogenase
VLATGKYIGGGIAADPRFTETVFGVDVAIERFGRVFRDATAVLALTDPARHEPQPLLALGVATDAQSRPVTASGDVAFDNVFVAGSVRAGIETATPGLAVATHDGWAAGERAARHAAGGSQ